MIDATQVVSLQQSLVASWHVDNQEGEQCSGVMRLVREQHRLNFLIWHEEDKARTPEAPDRHLADVKRSIDHFNQQRNDVIEQIDMWLHAWLVSNNISARIDARANTETPGSVIDRLSILALRIYHMREQCVRNDVSLDHVRRAQEKVELILTQQQHLAISFDDLWADLISGCKKMTLFRQFKMYNDPTLNPYMYQSMGLRGSERSRAQ